MRKSEVTEAKGTYGRMIYQTEATRERIIEAARELFLSNGFFETQMKDVAEKVGISRTSLYRYFRDKLDLGMAIIEVSFAFIEADSSWRDETSPFGTSALGRLDCFLRHSMIAPKFHRIRMFVAEFDAYFSGCRIPPDFTDRLRKHLRSNRIIVELIEEGMADGSIRPDLEPHLAMVTISNSVTALLQRLLLRGHALMEVRDGELERISGEHIRFLMDGLMARQ
ncbi:MAG: TetR/AcrR family transcriptional regulator [Treponemataceae bacterium]